MRIAVLILGLLLGLLMFFQTFLVYALSGATSNKASGSAGAMGLLMAILWLVASAAVIGAPLLSVVLFALAGVIGLAMAGDFSDLAVWAAASFILAGLSLIGWFTKRRDTRKSDARHQELVAAARRDS